MVTETRSVEKMNRNERILKRAIIEANNPFLPNSWVKVHREVSGIATCVTPRKSKLVFLVLSGILWLLRQ